jgi:signal transduction histidine kinase
MPGDAAHGHELGSLEALGLSRPELFEDVPCWISIQDRRLRVVEVSCKLIEDFGDRRRENCFAVYKGRTEPCSECPVLRTFEDGREHSSHEMIFDGRGMPHDVLVNTKPLRNRAGEIVAVMKVFADISAEKELERRLHDSLVRLHNLLDNAPCFISVQDPQFRIVESNQRFNSSFGEGHGGHCYEVYKKRADRCPRCPVAETFQDGEVHNSEEVVVDNQGRQVHVLVYAAPIRDPTGEITSVMEMSTDVTEIRTLQNRLATLGQLVGGVAHSIKNVLEGLRGGVYIVNLGFQDHNEQDIRAGWDMVQRNVGRLSSLIMDMLCCARERSPRRLPVALPNLLKEVAGLFARRAQEFGIELEIESVGPVEILGEPKDLHALVSNLVANSIDACNADQDSNKKHRIAARVFRDSGEAVIEVADNGLGMEPDVRNALFHGMVSTKGPAGTGLGLLVSHKVATEHGGKVFVSSEPGLGSKFTVRLPLKEPGPN